jgi:hypothetical protein
LLLLTSTIGVFRRKKNRHPDGGVVLTKKFQLEKMKSRLLRGAKFLVIFGPCNSDISQKEASGNYESMTTFALLIEIYLVWEFHKFCPAVLEKPLETGAEGGGALKRFVLRCTITLTLPKGSWKGLLALLMVKRLNKGVSTRVDLHHQCHEEFMILQSITNPLRVYRYYKPFHEPSKYTFFKGYMKTFWTLS